MIITYYWPPSGGVGVQRWMNFALQLKKRNWQPIILTPENPQFEIKDEKLVERVQELEVHKLPIWEPFQLFHKLTGNKERKNIKQGLVLEKTTKTFMDTLAVWVRGNLFIPDPRVFWYREASDFAIKLIKGEGIETVVTTGPPHSVHLIGRRIKRKTRVNWIADFRDPWSKWDILEKLNTSPLSMYMHKRLEAAVIKEADVVMTVSNRLAKSLGGAEVLNNGISVNQHVTSNPDAAQFTIGYFGMLNELRNPSQFWMLLDQMCRENEDFGAKLRIRIGGIVSESIKEELGRFRALKDKIEFLGYLPHEKVQDEYRKCNLLLLLLNKSDNSQWILPVKFFEYLSASRMILALGPKKSDLGEIMNKADVGEICSYSDIQGMRSFVEEVFEEQITPSKAEIMTLLHRFSHENLVEKLEEVLNQLTKQKEEIK